GRQFWLPKNARWSNDRPLNAVDVRATVDLLKKGKGTGRPPAWGELLQPVVVRDPYRLDLILSQGYLDPLALMTFKVLPQGAPADTKEFAENPVGSGPYRFVGRDSEGSTGRPYVGFVANPHYGQRSGKFGLPHIREVRFFSTADPVKDLE